MTALSEDKMDPEVKRILKACGKDPKCESVTRRITVYDGSAAHHEEPIVFIRTPSAGEMKIARFKGETGAYILMVIPDHEVDMALVRLFQGK